MDPSYIDYIRHFECGRGEPYDYIPRNKYPYKPKYPKCYFCSKKSLRWRAGYFSGRRGVFWLLFEVRPNGYTIDLHSCQGYDKFLKKKIRQKGELRIASDSSTKDEVMGLI